MNAMMDRPTNASRSRLPARPTVDETKKDGETEIDTQQQSKRAQSERRPQHQPEQQHRAQARTRQLGPCPQQRTGRARHDGGEGFPLPNRAAFHGFPKPA